MLDLRAYARLCGEIARASKVLSNKRTLVAFAYAPLEQFMKDKEKPLCEPAQRTLTYVTGEQNGFDTVIRTRA